MYQREEKPLKEQYTLIEQSINFYSYIYWYHPVCGIILNTFSDPLCSKLCWAGIIGGSLSLCEVSKSIFIMVEDERWHSTRQCSASVITTGILLQLADGILICSGSNNELSIILTW